LLVRFVSILWLHRVLTINDPSFLISIIYWLRSNEVRRRAYTTSSNYLLVCRAENSISSSSYRISCYYWFLHSSSILVCILLGLANGYLSNIGHETAHFAFGKNNIMFHIISFTGHDSTWWFNTHNRLHHLETNVPFVDPDIHHLPYMRHIPQEPWVPLYQYQHIYSYLVYSMASVRYFFVPFDPKKKIHALLLCVIFPYYMGFGIWESLFRFLVMLITCSYFLALINVINHTNDLVQFQVRSKDFFEHQMLTTMNWGSTSMLQNFISGGLNNQIEHHLFPSVISIALPYIAPIVKEFAKEKGLPYSEVDNFFSGLSAHHRHLVEMGKNPKSK